MRQDRLSSLRYGLGLWITNEFVIHSVFVFVVPLF